VSVVLIAILTGLVSCRPCHYFEAADQAWRHDCIPGLGGSSPSSDIAPRGLLLEAHPRHQRKPVLVSVADRGPAAGGGAGPERGQHSDDVIRSHRRNAIPDDAGGRFPLATPPQVQLVSDTGGAEAATWAEDVRDIPNVTEVSARSRSTNLPGVQVDVEEHMAPTSCATSGRIAPASTTGGRVGYRLRRLHDPCCAGAVGGLIIVATFVLFLMTGSVVIPITALVISVISLRAAVGVLVWDSGGTSPGCSTSTPTTSPASTPRPGARTHLRLRPGHGL
jgi:RND superfamily putative drug exporter